MRRKPKYAYREEPKGIKRFNKKLILSVVALVEIILIALVSTYAWVETVSTIKIYTGSNGTTSKTGSILDRTSRKVSVSASAGSEIDLSGTFHAAGDFHLAPATSADGQNFFFRSANNGTTANYRTATSSDNMVNYASFSFRVAQANTFVFNDNPTIKFGDTAISNNLVRVALSVYDTSTAPHTYSTRIFGKTAATENVINNVNGTSTGSSTIKSFSSCTSGKTDYAVKTTGDNQIMTVKVWIQDPTFASATTYSNKKLTISGLKLVPAYQVTARVSVNDTAVSNSNVATVSLGTTATASHSYLHTLYVKYNGAIDFYTYNKDTTNYNFQGWSTTQSGSVSSSSNPYSRTITGNLTLYAKYQRKYTITANAVLGTSTTPSSTYGTVQVDTNTAGATSTGTYSNGTNNITLYATPTNNYAIIGWYKNGTSASNFINNSNGKTNITVNASGSSSFSDTYYCSFKEKTTTTIYLIDRQYSNPRIYVWGKTTNQIYSDAFGTNGGSSLSFTKSNGLYKFTFVTGEDEDIGIIYSDGGSSTNRTEHTAHIGNTSLIKEAGQSINNSFSLGSNRYLYCTDNQGWGQMKCHYWGGTGTNTKWSGNNMSVAGVNSSNQNVYYIQIPNTKTYCIFNKGENGNSNQTVDITLITSECRYYPSTQSGDGKWNVGDW